MLKNTYLSVIIPAYNEASRIHECLGSWTSYLWNSTSYPFEIIVVLNGCTDNTLGMLQYWLEEWVQVKAIVLDKAGKGAAVRAGMLAASGRYCYMADVDLSTPASAVREFINIIACRRHDLVIGSRCNPTIVKQSARRALMGRIFHVLTSKIVPGIQDTQCGFKMFTNEAAVNLFSNLQTTGWAFDVEILREARRNGYRIAEHPVVWKENGESKVRPVRDSLRMVGELAKISALPHSQVRTPVRV
jgi:dolichyl-phosphate beta-glucosyltransferase